MRDRRGSIRRCGSRCTLTVDLWPALRADPTRCGLMQSHIFTWVQCISVFSYHDESIGTRWSFPPRPRPPWRCDSHCSCAGRGPVGPISSLQVKEYFVRCTLRKRPNCGRQRTWYCNTYGMTIKPNDTRCRVVAGPETEVCGDHLRQGMTGVSMDAVPNLVV